MPVLTSGADFKIVPAGNWGGRLISLIDYGTQPQKYQGEEKDPKRECYLRWELLGKTTRLDDGRPMVIGKRYTFSNSPKSNLRKVLEAWRGVPFKPGEQFHLETMLGQAGLVNVTHYTNTEGEEKAVVATVTVPPEDYNIPPLENEVTLFWMDSENFNMEVFETFPDWMKTLISSSPEFQQMSGTAPAPVKRTKHKPVMDEQLDLEDADAPF